jgi:hypothetical protein
MRTGHTRERGTKGQRYVRPARTQAQGKEDGGVERELGLGRASGRYEGCWAGTPSVTGLRRESHGGLNTMRRRAKRRKGHAVLACVLSAVGGRHLDMKRAGVTVGRLAVASFSCTGSGSSG